ncbi:SIR2 family protein [Bdellovibrio bacteriovorus]|uniref:SIR2 family protein n=1 Tax=Bdellovibrio bacteriovorus TaxID=959 RepID=UPI003D023F06
MKDLTIDLDTFLNRFEVRPSKSYAFFLGSGTSVQSGIPTGGQLVWDFKRRIYCNHHKIPIEKFNDLESDENRKTIQDFLIAQKLIPTDPSLEYSFYFEKCFPSRDDRKYFIQGKVNNAAPSIGHKCLGKLFVDGISDNIFTTNFDELIESGIHLVKSGHSFLVLSPEKEGKLQELGKTQYSKVIKLHGDYRYDALKNASSELQSLDKNLSSYFENTLKEKGIIIVGYSGSDESILAVLESIVDKEDYLPHGLVWCLRHGQVPNERVLKLIKKAKEINEHSGILVIDNFDEISYLLYKKKCSIDESIEKESRTLVNRKQPFEMDAAPPNNSPIILNSLEITRFPKTALAVDAGELRWANLKSVSSKDKVVFSLFKGKIYLWGEKADISQYLVELGINQTPTTIDLHKSKLTEDSSFYQGMIYSALQVHFKRKGLNTFRKDGVFDQNSRISDRGIPSGYSAYEAAELQLFWAENSLRLLIAPTIYIKGPNPEIKNDPTITALVNRIKSNRYNAAVGNLLKTWREKLFQSAEEKVSIGSFSLIITNRFAFAGYPQTNQTHFFKRVKFFDEPKILFNQTDLSKETVHPLKGLRDFSPYEHNLTGKSSPIRLAVITADNSFNEVKRHLDALNTETSNSNLKEQYLVSYPGFYKIYKAMLDVPTSMDQTRLILINNRDLIGKTCIEFYDLIKNCIDSLALNKHNFDLLIVYVPTGWSQFRELKNDDFYFDLHDSVKLYGAKKGIKIQFIEKKSLDYQDQLRVKWWLSQGLYVKGAGIPWKVRTSSANTAYIGLGYALKDGKTLLAASQLFDERGQGLRVLLQPIRKHTFIGKNPFMSKDDARRLITTLRESYFSSGVNAKLDRLVIHKSNFFNRDEIEGITQALDGIQNIELVQIQESNLWKGVRWNSEFQNGKWKNRDQNNPYHMFPLQRGAAIQIDDFSTLLWTDGSVQNPELNNPRYNYFQSARGIPSPLLIRRFLGTDPVDILIQDILKLTKMNWNSGGFYKRLPVTIEFSKILAEMAKQSEELVGTYAYDFRYFI